MPSVQDRLDTEAAKKSLAEEVGIDAWNMHEKWAIILGKRLWLNDFECQLSVDFEAYMEENDGRPY